MSPESVVSTGGGEIAIDGNPYSFETTVDLELGNSLRQKWNEFLVERDDKRLITFPLKCRVGIALTAKAYKISSEDSLVRRLAPPIYRSRIIPEMQFSMEKRVNVAYFRNEEQFLSFWSFMYYWDLSKDPKKDSSKLIEQTVTGLGPYHPLTRNLSYAPGIDGVLDGVLMEDIEYLKKKTVSEISNANNNIAGLKLDGSDIINVRKLAEVLTLPLIRFVIRNTLFFLEKYYGQDMPRKYISDGDLTNQGFVFGVQFICKNFAQNPNLPLLMSEQLLKQRLNRVTVK